MTNEDAHRESGLLAQWVGVLLPPVVCAAQMEANFVLVSQVCSNHRRVELYAVTAVAALLTLAAAAISQSVWKRSNAGSINQGDAKSRAHFISEVGLLSCGIFLLVIIAQGIATIYFDPCQL